MRKTPIVRDPKIYGWAIERGYASKKIPKRKIPPRPLFGLSLIDFQKKFINKIAKARMSILAEWK
jgi:hypothetical protein